MKRLVVAALIGLAPPALAVAQTAPAAQAAAPAAVDPVKLELAGQLIELSGGRKQADLQIRAMFGSIQAGMSQYLPADQSKLVGLLYQDLSDEMVEVSPKLLDLSAHIYAENYSERELRDLIAFRSSETGRSIALKQPAIQAEAVRETVPLVMAMMPQIMQKTLDRACEEAHCTAAQRQIASDAMAKAMQKQGA
jgi:hypothetical protein